MALLRANNVAIAGIVAGDPTHIKLDDGHVYMRGKIRYRVPDDVLENGNFAFEYYDFTVWGVNVDKYKDILVDGSPVMLTGRLRNSQMISEVGHQIRRVEICVRGVRILSEE